MLDTRHSAAMYPAGHSEHRLHIVFLRVYEELDMPSASNAEGQLQSLPLTAVYSTAKATRQQLYFLNLILNREILQTI